MTNVDRGCEHLLLFHRATRLAHADWQSISVNIWDKGSLFLCCRCLMKFFPIFCYTLLVFCTYVCCKVGTYSRLPSTLLYYYGWFIIIYSVLRSSCTRSYFLFRTRLTWKVFVGIGQTMVQCLVQCLPICNIVKTLQLCISAITLQHVQPRELLDICY